MADPWVHQLERGGSGLAKIGVGFGVCLTLAALWPTYYGLQRPGGLDYEALIAGAIGLSVGFSCLMLSVRTLRAPKSKVLVDLKARTVRILGPKLDVSGALDGLGPLKIERRIVTVRSKHGTSRTPWFAVMAPAAFDDLKIFDSADKDASQAWAERLNRLAAAPEPTALSYDEVAMAEAKAALGLEADGVLWRAVPKADGNHLIAAALVQTVRADLKARGGPVGRFLASPTFGAIAFLLLLALTLRAVLLVFEFEGSVGQFAIAASILGALSALWLGGLRGALLSLCVGASFVAKTLFDPVISSYAGQTHAYGLTSETHLMINGPGMALIVFGVILYFSSRRPKTSTARSA